LTNITTAFKGLRTRNCLSGFVLIPDGTLLNPQSGFAVPVGPVFASLDEVIVTDPKGAIGCWENEEGSWNHQQLALYHSKATAVMAVDRLADGLWLRINPSERGVLLVRGEGDQGMRNKNRSHLHANAKFDSRSPPPNC